LQRNYIVRAGPLQDYPIAICDSDQQRDQQDRREMVPGGRPDEPTRCGTMPFPS
jgi:hypothetical protein